ncbi:MAG TPA: Clp protease N-terminal domain-containing protein [Solirubrobacteraceae bacterium]|nr:Clp protease N-terminal domain-containing protein [Solirubrobacteraceae bacterium]
MTTRTKKLATLLTAGVALSSGAYALGSQAGDGGAVAAGTTGSGAATSGATISTTGDRGPRGACAFRRGGFGVDALADRLGVSETALRGALRAIRDSRTPEQRRTELVRALAAALNKPAADVQRAVDSVLPARDDRKADLAAAIARELGVDAAKVRSAFDTLRRQFRDRDRDGRRGDRRDALVDAIASATGIDAARVRAALEKLHDARRGDRRDRRAEVRGRLASALGVTTDQLDRAIDKVRADQRNAFATALAQRLNVDVRKVQDALEDLPRRGRRGG